MSRSLRVAIVGAGPSGIYAADALTSQGEVDVEVDVIDRLPVPFGLVRYGVAPDHLGIRSVRTTLERVFDRPGVRFVGGVDVGTDLTLDAVRAAYDAVILTYGAARDRRLGIPGEDLPGSIAATDFVNWYCGHPDSNSAVIRSALEGARVAVVVGVGNVAVDVSRVLAKTLAEVDHTDMPQSVLDTLAATSISDVHLVGRRGPVQATFTTKELRELGELEDCDVVVPASSVDLDPFSAAAATQDRVAARNVEVIREWAGRTPGAAARRIHVHFFWRPVEIRGTDRVESIVLERTALDAEGTLCGTGELWELPCDLVVRSVGYRGVGLPGVPFDDQRGVVVHSEGRVDAGLYVAGWIKRGPSGIIGTNKKDAAATVATLLADAPSLLERARPDGIGPLIDEDSVIDFDGWRRIDAAEIALGARHGRDRTTIHTWDGLRAAARPATT